MITLCGYHLFQLLNLNDSELDWVVRHLGHSKLTHFQNYRLSSSTIERTKVAKLLVLLEQGMLEEAQGSNLSDNQLDGNLTFTNSWRNNVDVLNTACNL